MLKDDVGEILITEEELQARIAELGRAISADYQGKDLLAICTESSGVVRILMDLRTSIEGRNVLIVEDIVDTGLTLGYIIDNLKTRRPTSLRICALLNKRERRQVDVPLDYVGFDIPDKFVVGYGLDYDEKYRNLPFIGVLKPELYSE
jgi:hypoxanthine phosphoribosyltransferase